MEIIHSYLFGKYWLPVLQQKSKVNDAFSLSDSDYDTISTTVESYNCVVSSCRQKRHLQELYTLEEPAY